MMKLVGHQMPGLFYYCTDQFEVFWRFHAMAEVDCWCIHTRDKQTGEMAINAVSVFHQFLTWYLPIFLMVLRY